MPFEGLNEEQTQAVTHAAGPLLIVAGAGTGKTTVITRRIAWLIEQKMAKPEEILALTFTDKAAGEMEERVDLLLPYGYVDIQISTFHAFCEKILREYGAEIGLSRDFKLANELDAWLIARQEFDRFALDYFRPLGNRTKYLRSLLTHFSRAKDAAVDPDAYLKFAEEKKANLDTLQSDEEATSDVIRLQELANAYKTYQTILLERDTLDFGDLMMYMLKMLRERPRVLAALRKRFRYILVDEFQDTNVSQYEIIKILAAPRNDLTVVGDDDQSIYKFRGASVANILQFQNDFPDARRIVLTHNYRSSQSILDTSHAFIQKNNPNRLEAGDDTLNKRLISHAEKEGVIEHLHCVTSEQEAELVLKKILELRKKDPETSWSDFAILLRSNDAADPFIAAFERARVPYQFLALSGLYTKSVILDVLALLRVIDNPYDSPSFYRLLGMPLFNIAAFELSELTHLANRKGKTLFEACGMAGAFASIRPETLERVHAILRLTASIREEAPRRRVSELMIRACKDSGLIAHINNKNEQEKYDAFRHLQQFLERVKRFEQQNDHAVLHTFLEEFQEERSAGEEGSLAFDVESGPDVIKLMTVHASKGLEFRHVFVVNLVDRRFPTQARGEAIPLPDGLVNERLPEGDWHLEEERRLFYVAMTRAKEGLFFTSAEEYGGARKKKWSRFLHELGYRPEDASIPAAAEFNDVCDQQPVVLSEQHLAIPVPKQFSFTQLAAFKMCPLQYKFAHVLKIPVFGKGQFSFGKTMHNTLHAFFSQRLERAAQKQGVLFEDTAAALSPYDTSHSSLDDLLSIYGKEWQDDWFKDDKEREEYRERGGKSLRALHASFKDLPPRPLFLEIGFTVKIGEIVLKGRMDRVDAYEDGVEIIDYKTGHPKKELTPEDKEQLFLYQLAARDVLSLKPKKLSFHYLEDNSRVSFLGTDEELLDFQEKVAERVAGIKASVFPPKAGPHCKFCDFRDICEWRE